MTDQPARTTWPSRFRTSFTDPRPRPGGILAGVLCALLAFAAVVQVRARDAGSQLEGARESDLVAILDNVTEQSRRLQEERGELLTRKDNLESGADRDQAALEEATERAQTLGILAGTLPATGPGIVLRIADPDAVVTADLLLNTVQEVRDAGAEAIQLDDDRIVASTDFLDGGAGVVLVDGAASAPPYVFTIIGDPDTLSTALGIPGGALAALAERGASGSVSEQTDLLIDAVRPPEQMPNSRASRDGPRGDR